MLTMFLTVCASALALVFVFRGFPWRRFLADEIGGMGDFRIPILSKGRLAQLFGEELFVAPPSWKVAAWFIDPINGNDSNDGQTAATAVKSWNGGIISRWGTTQPVLAQTTTVTWLNDAPSDDSDPVIARPIMINAVLILQGLLSADTLVASGVLAGTVAKSRVGAGQLLTATLAAGTATRMLVKNTTAGKESIAFVYEAAGAKWALTQPLTAFTVPVPELGAWSEVDTWADGDTYEIYQLTKVNLSYLRPVMVAPSAALGFAPVLQVIHLDANTVDGTPATSNLTIDNGISMFESTGISVVIDEATGDDLVRQIANCSFTAGSTGLMSSSTDTRFIGGCMSNQDAPLPLGVPWGFDGDSILDAAAAPDFSLGTTGIQAGMVIPGLGACYIRGVLCPVGDLASFRSDVTPGNHAVIYGTGSLDLKYRARYIYNSFTSTAVATWQNTGGLLINGSLNANPWDPVTGAWQPQIAITPANLDAAFGPAGFGSRAVDPTGGCIIGSTSF